MDRSDWRVKQPLSDKEFLTHISKSLGIKNFRYSRGSKSKIKKVAVCGGSSSDHDETCNTKQLPMHLLLRDIKYPTFQMQKNEIMLVDAGPYETEIPSLDDLKKQN